MPNIDLFKKELKGLFIKYGLGITTDVFYNIMITKVTEYDGLTLPDTYIIDEELQKEGD